MYFEELAIRPLLHARLDAAHPKVFRLAKYEDLYGFGWSDGSRRVSSATSCVPFSVWKACSPHTTRSSTWAFGCEASSSTHGSTASFLAVVLPLLVAVSRQPDFGSYYPFYKGCSRSYYDYLLWEGMYFAQFFALELFFRGFWLAALRRSFGSGAIFAMAVPYCMIHFGKPFLEVNGAIVAGIALGSLSMKTKSIYQGFLVHITVAGLMDFLALWHRHALPTVFWPPG